MNTWVLVAITLSMVGWGYLWKLLDMRDKRAGIVKLILADVKDHDID